MPTATDSTDLEEHFAQFRRHIVGIDQCIETPQHDEIRMLYADWTASGRGYAPIEQRLMSEILPFISNTHTEATFASRFITDRYAQAREKIKKHVNASAEDVLISYGSGMTDVVNKFQRMLGLRTPTVVDRPSDEEVPVVFLTHMEHHSNHTSWLETICDVVVVPPDNDGSVSLQNFEAEIFRYSCRTTKIASITACSNVTGIATPYFEIADLMHAHGGVCFVDFACSAPYVTIDMHPSETTYLDAVFFSPHKFLGGPGATGILVCHEGLINSRVPDVSGGGTVNWTNPWGGRSYVNNLEEREDGGTPAILQTIKASYAIELKEDMGVEKMLARELELMQIFWDRFNPHQKIEVLEGHRRDRLGVLSFNIRGKHYMSVVQELNDHFGIQARGGCSCAGTYGHYLLNVDQQASRSITDRIDRGDLTQKPGWVRISIHPTTSTEEALLIAEAVERCATTRFKHL